MLLVLGVVLEERWWLKFSVDSKETSPTQLACIIGGFIKALNLDSMQMLLGFLEGAGFARLRNVCGTKNCRTILMAYPLKVCHWLHNNGWQQCPPKATKRCIGDSININFLFSNTVVHTPYASLGDARRKQLNVRSTVSRYPSRE